MRHGDRDIATGTVLGVLAVALLFAIPGQVETVEGDSLTPAFVPSAATAFIAVLAMALVLQGWRNRDVGVARKASDTRPDYRALRHVAVTVGAMGAYVAAIPWLGYLTATAAALGCFAWLYGNRNLKQILIVALIAPPAILLFFRYTMLVLLPQGRLFG